MIRTISIQTWFRVMWHICLQKNGISALGIQRSLGLPSYQTAWLCLHKLRKAMIRQGRDRLSWEISKPASFRICDIVQDTVEFRSEMTGFHFVAIMQEQDQNLNKSR